MACGVHELQRQSGRGKAVMARSGRGVSVPGAGMEGGRTGEERSARALLLSGGGAPGRAEEGGGCIGMEGWSGAEREEQVDRVEIPRLEGDCRWRRLEGTKVLEFRVRGYL